ncbi:carbohydrate ABC transporter permease [Acholeplasma laidlawii]|uniref:carbohydrate ABC transporter permease n=1 Tax=Acholeplasma laidlawii TaxID=2148 RepID=UPI0018C2A7A6|nr:carbohydrate ABC transporter permease [Acholeplasma laidlawii]MBG0762695.1 carbohydrate ABC transporter permease [Acholeplasma laidlawii]
MFKKKIDPLKLTSYVLLTLGLIIVVLPMFYMVVSAFKDNDQVFAYPPKIIPSLSELTLENFKYVFDNSPFITYFLNTIFVALMTVLISIIVSSTLAYSFARLYIPGKKIIFGLVLSIMMIPGLALIVPQFELAVMFKLVNNVWGVILFYVAWVTPFSTFLIKGYIEDNIPLELEESIQVDGGSIFTVYKNIILPMTSPVIASISILNFLFPFEELGWSTAILKTDKYRTLPVAITMFFQSHGRTDWGYVFSMTTMAMIPVLIIYILLQKFFISGLSSGSIKG